MGQAHRIVLFAAAAALWCVAATPALGAVVNATTNEGGSCQLQTTASRATPAAISYRVNVQPCTARFGIRYAVSVGGAYDTTNGEDSGGAMAMTSGPIPYSNPSIGDTTFVVNPLNVLDHYFTRVDVSVVLTSGVVTKTTRHKRVCRRPHPDADDRGLGPGGDHDGDDKRRCHRPAPTVTTHLEHWLDPGAECIVSTTFKASDTLGCILVDQLP